VNLLESVKHQSRDDISKRYSLLICTYAGSNKLEIGTTVLMLTGVIIVIGNLEHHGYKISSK